MSHDQYENPLISRYASEEMSRIFSPQHKHSTWRRLWVALAEAEAELGLGVSAEQVAQLKAHVDDIDFDAAAKYEEQLRHDVMAHVHAYGDQCPEARAIIHLGATSCFVTDNTDLILLREALELVCEKTASVIDALGTFAAEYKDMPTLGFTHLQPAQPTTVGRRACLWAYDLALDLVELEHRLNTLRARSTKGTTGTQASFLELFGGDHAKVRQLEQLVAEKMGFALTYVVTGQTYSRKIDTQAMDALSGVATSAHKAASDLRILAHRKEVEEPFEKSQIGSSAMAYKRNPMRSERICGLARFVMSLQSSAAATAATQWMERTLDDKREPTADNSAGVFGDRRGVDFVSQRDQWVSGVSRGDRAEFTRRAAVYGNREHNDGSRGGGGDRQDLHERIRQHSQAAGAEVKQHGRSNDLLERLTKDKAFAGVDLAAEVEASKLTGRSAEQVDEFLAEVVQPIRERYADRQAGETELRV